MTQNVPLKENRPALPLPPRKYLMTVRARPRAKRLADQTNSPTVAEEVAKPPTVSANSPETSQSVKKTSTTGKPKTTPVKPKSAMSALEHAKFQEEKVRALFAKYNQILEVGEWTPPVKSDVPRVEKKVRLRVHRKCHQCQTQFGADRLCKNCEHEKCKKCPRYPPKKTEKVKGKETAAVAKQDGGLIKKPIHRRGPRVICHECQTAFKSKSKPCENCNHQRCAQCQRAP